MMRYITKRREYLSFQQTDKVIHSPYFLVLCLRDAEPFFSVGITISKKVGNAVVRNRTKRRIKACLRETNTGKVSGWKINLIARTPLTTTDFITLKASLEKILAELEK
ncbi:MAG TPA: ribonuclease P protein component [Candidatus Cloacimonadota bacterium]|nr:ribonuclease P protein component [Candidatus Cloacimonadota bacterium]